MPRERGHPQREKPSVAVERELRVRDVVARLVVAHERLAPRRHPFQRPLQLSRGPCQNDLLGIMLALGAEPSADVRSDHAHRVLRQPELLGDELADMVRHLGRRVDHHLVAFQSALGRGDGDDGARLDRRARDAVIDDVDASRHAAHCGALRSPRARCRAESALPGCREPRHEAAARRAARRRARREPPPAAPSRLRPARRHRAPARRSPPPPRRALRPRAAPHRARGPSEAARSSWCRSRPVCAITMPSRRRRPRPCRHRCRRRLRPAPSRRGRIDAPDACMGMRRSHEGAVQLSFEHKVGHELALAGEEAHVLAAQHRGADSFGMAAHRIERLIDRAFIVIIGRREKNATLTRRACMERNPLQKHVRIAGARRLRRGAGAGQGEDGAVHRLVGDAVLHRRRARLLQGREPRGGGRPARHAPAHRAGARQGRPRHRIEPALARGREHQRAAPGHGKLLLDQLPEHQVPARGVRGVREEHHRSAR